MPTARGSPQGPVPSSQPLHGNPRQVAPPPLQSTANRGRAATDWSSSNSPLCQWAGANNKHCKRPSQRGRLFCKVHCCAKPGCRTGCSSKEKFCPEHSGKGAGKSQGKLGNRDVSRCDECHCKLAVCVCKEAQTRIRSKSRSKSKTVSNPGTECEMDL